MRALIVLCSLVALGAARPGWSYSSIDYTNPALLATRGYFGGHTYATAPFTALPATTSYVAAPTVIATRTVAAAPVVAAAPDVVSAPVVATRTVAAAPLAATVPAVITAPAAIKTQWHAQDEVGQAAYGHAEPSQTHRATQDAFGNKVGSFSYLNPTDGQIHRTDYIADALGYRVTANDLPIAASAPIVDTPEVAIAKAAHLAIHRAKRGVVFAAAHTPANTVPLVAPIVPTAPITSYAPAPVVAPAAIPYATPAVLPAVLRDATLTTIVNTPGHAISYRVD